MTTLPEILKQFDEKFEEDKYKTVPTWLDVKVEKVKSFLTQTYTSMVQAEVEHLEQELAIQRQVYEKGKEVVVFGRARVAGMVAEKYTRLGKIEMLEDQINYWKNKLK